MFKYLTNRPIAVIVSFVALLLLGLSAGQIIPTSLLPKIDIPEINVQVEAKEFSPREVEQKIISPLRATLSQIRQLEDLQSVSLEGRGNIKMNFSHNTDMSMAVISVNEKIDLLMKELPKEIERPQVMRLSISDIPILHLQVQNNSDNSNPQKFADLSRFVNNILRRRLEQLPEISMVDVTGYEESQILLEPKMDRMKAMGLDNSQLISLFDQSNVDLGNIQVVDGHYRYFIKFISNINDIEQVRNIPLKINSRVFKLADLVDVSIGIIPAKGAFYNKKGQAIDLAVIKQSDSKIEDLQKSFNNLLKKFEEEYPELTFNITQDQTFLLDYAIGNLRQDLLLGGILAFVCMIIFIRKWKAAILIGITIPVTLVLTQIGFYLFDISFNLLSLGGLILGLGMIIDNSIVVIDTINLHQVQGKTLEDSVVEGPNEIVIPLFSSVLTNCAVFLPLIFLSGIAGAIFYDQALSVTIGVLTSMLVSIILLPPLFLLLHNSNRFKILDKYELPNFVSVTNLYDKGITWVFKNKFTTITLVILIFLIGLFSFNSMEKERLPKITRNNAQINIDWNKYISLDTSVARITNLLAPFSGKFTNCDMWVGSQQYLLSDMQEIGSNGSRIYLEVKNQKLLDSILYGINTQFKLLYPDAVFQMVPAPNAFDAIFSERDAPFIIQIRDKELGTLPKFHLTDSIRTTILNQFPSITIPAIAKDRELILTIDVEKAALYGVNEFSIRSIISNKLKSLYLGQLQAAESSLPIRIGAEYFKTFRDLLVESHVIGRNGQAYPLNIFVDAKHIENYREITATKQGEYYPIRVTGGNPVDIATFITNQIKEKPSPVSVQFSGGYFNNRDLIKQMSYILIISIMLLYFILAAQFESLLQPLFILTELPIAIMGAMITLYIGGNSINLMSMIGIVIMSGLVINDSILKIDAINKYRKQGYKLFEAIHEGGLRRLKPMVMITLTSVGALLPTLFMEDLGSELQKPLALALLGGITIGLLVSLFFVPLIYWLVYRRSEKI